jgi:antitoxin component YwqK of YwqJK toxin-antitoxin module
MTINLTWQALLLTLLSAALHAQDTLFFDSKWKSCGKSDAVYYRIDMKSGKQWVRRDYYADVNKLQMEGTMKSLDPEVKEGLFKYYHPNGQVSLVGSYAGNLRQGEFRSYYESGKPESVENYKDGQLHGPTRAWLEDGRPVLDANFSNDLMDGPARLYRKDGSLHSEGVFQRGYRMGVWKFYDEAGKEFTTHEYKTDYLIKEANMKMNVPNTDWELVEYTDQPQVVYTFKRAEIEDSTGRRIIPAIIIFVEDAAKYDGDVVVFSTAKRARFNGRGIEVKKVMTSESPGWPMEYTNALLFQCSYSEGELGHVLYMTYIITKGGKAVQVYLDMTKSIAGSYEHEFWTTLSSLKEAK